MPVPCLTFGFWGIRFGGLYFSKSDLAAGAPEKWRRLFLVACRLDDRAVALRYSLAYPVIDFGRQPRHAELRHLDAVREMALLLQPFDGREREVGAVSYLFAVE